MPERAIFLDRDNTLIEDPGYINDPEQVKLIDGTAEVLIELKKMGYKLIIVSNQSAVARGIVTEKVLAKIHEKLEKLLAQQGAKIDRIYYCPYHPEGVIPKYRAESDLRKPRPGMILKAAEDMDIDLPHSWLIGDSARDIEAGKSAGCTTILIENASHNRTLEPKMEAPDYRAVNMKEVVNIIKKHDHDLEKMNNPAGTETGQQNKDQYTPLYELKAKPKDDLSQKPLSDISGTERLLNEILEQLRKNQRAELFSEFSMTRLMAGIVQVVVLFCLLVSIWLLMSPTRQTDAVLVTLCFAIVLQIMALTFFIMHGQK
ncbi:MAG: HAD family hydrolase [Sedimentisphaerales bacterium]|nr:HAD family hydrolase [Sedimentisphaerales bacterium]